MLEEWYRRQLKAAIVPLIAKWEPLKPRECLEYIVVHEIVHLLEPTHNDRFVALLDRFMPRSQVHRDTLNRLPVRHERWAY